MTNIRKDIFAVLILLVVIVIRFYPFVVQGVPLNTDSWKRIYPWHYDYTLEEIISTDYDYNSEYNVWFPFAKEQMEDGVFPHWNPYSFCGAPLYANHLVPIFHAPLGAAMLIWDGHLIATGYAFLMAIMGTLFFYWFLRNWRFSVFISLFGGLVYFLSGWHLYITPPEVATFIWIPAILLFHDRFLKSNRMSDACLGALCVSQILIAGYPIYVAHFFYFVLGYIIWRRFHPSFKWETPVKRWVIAILIMAVLGGLISAVQNYPTYEHMKVSNRTITTERESFRAVDEMIEERQHMVERVGRDPKIDIYMFVIAKRAMFVVPWYHTDLGFNRNYAGPVVILLSFIALFLAPAKWRVIKIFYVLFGLFVIISPIYPIAAKIVPGWAISTLLPRAAFFFLMYFLAVVGLDTLLKLNKRSIPAFGLSVFMIILTFALTIVPSAQEYQREMVSYRWNESLDYYIRWTIIFAQLIIVCVIAYKALGERVRVSIANASLTLFLIIGMITQFYLFTYFNNPDPMPEDSKTREMIAALEHGNNGRITRYSTKSPHVSGYYLQKYLFLSNIPTRFEVYDTHGYDSLMLADYDIFYETAAPGNIINGRGMFCVRDELSLNPNNFLNQATFTRFVLYEDEDISHLDYDFEEVYSLTEYDNSGNTIHDFRIIRFPIDTPPNHRAKLVFDYELESEYTGDFITDDFSGKVLLEKHQEISIGARHYKGRNKTNGTIPEIALGSSKEHSIASSRAESMIRYLKYPVIMLSSRRIMDVVEGSLLFLAFFNNPVLLASHDHSEIKPAELHRSKYIEVEDISSTELKIQFTTDHDAILYIPDSYHPRWHAKLNGDDVEILKANMAFRAIAVPAGTHEVFMWYDGRDVVYGAIASIAGLILLFIIYLPDRKKSS